MTDVLAVIPARWGAKRFPGKLLADLAGRTVLEHTWRAAAEAFPNVRIATDDLRIASVAEAFGARVVKTSDAPTCGTERVWEAAQAHPASRVINIQGDEPHLRPADLRRVADALDDPSVRVATLCFPVGRDAAHDPDRVKVVRNQRGDALLFSRAPIPYPRDGEAGAWLQHVGVYAFHRPTLARYASLPQPVCEQLERLEQLRLLHAGIPIRVLECAPLPPPIDRPTDLERG